MESEASKAQEATRAASGIESDAQRTLAVGAAPLLVVVEGRCQGLTALVTAKETWIGRSSENQLVLDSAGVSRRHARVLEESHRHFVEDLGSTQGTEVNGTRIESRKPIPLCHGDYLRIFDHLILFHERAQVEPAQPISSIRIDKSRVRAEADALLEAVPGIEEARRHQTE